MIPLSGMIVNGGRAPAGRCSSRSTRRAQVGNLVTQLVRPVGAGAELAQLEPDLTELARDVVPEQHDFVLEAGDTFRKRVHASTQLRELATHLLAPLQELCALKLT